MPARVVMIDRRWAPALVLAAAPHHREFRFGLILLALVVVGGLIYGGIRLSDRRAARGRPGGPRHGDRQVPPPPPPERAGPPEAAPPAGAVPPPAPAPPAPAPPAVLTGTAIVDGSEGAADVRPPAKAVEPPPVRRRRPFGRHDGWAVETHGLTKRFGDIVAVDHVELNVPRGCAFGYLGPNGAGKTTLLRTLLGLTHADAGTMSLLGVPVPAERSRALARVGAIVDEPRFHPHLTGEQNLRLLAAARGAGAGERVGPALVRVGLRERAADKVASYSMGMRQRLGVAACLLGDPELLILDEPMNGLDPAGMQEMRTMIETLVDEGRTVMLCSHLLDEVERTCDAVAIVDRGRVIRQGPIEELVRSANVVVRVGCSDPPTAERAVREAGFAAGVTSGELGLTVTLPAGSSRETVAEIARVLVGHGISVYSVQEVRTTLENWFLSVTSRLGERP